MRGIHGEAKQPLNRETIQLSQAPVEVGVHRLIPVLFSMALEVEWDPAKAARNLEKHGISFEEAATVLGDPLSITLADPDHSQDEERFLLLGESQSRQHLIVSLVERGDRIRIVNARRMTKRERTDYEKARP